VSAASDSDFEEAVLRIMKNELDPKKYRLVQVASKTSAAQWS
jgi:hypothetical protein